MAHEQTVSVSKKIALEPTAAAGGSSPRSVIAILVAFAAVAVIGVGLPYPAEARFVLVVFALAILGWTLFKIDDTVVALAAVAALLVGGAVPLSTIATTLKNPLIGLLVGAFVIATALTRSGLAERVVIATIGNVRSVTRLFHRLAFLILATAFVIPSTTGRAVLFLPVFLTLAASIRDLQVVRALALLIPSIVLLSACASLTGAGAHLVAAEFITRSGGALLDYARWTVLCFPFAVASSFVATSVILWLFLDRETRMAAPKLPSIPRDPLNPRQRAVAMIVAVMLVALLSATAVGIEPALVVLVAATLLVIGPSPALLPATALKTIEWKLLAFLAATMLMGDALIVSGAARVVAADLVTRIDWQAFGSPLAVATIVSATALCAHLVVTSRTARAVVLIPILALPLAGFGYDPAALILLVAVGTGFCQTLPVSAKAVALYATLTQPTYAPKDLMLLSAVLLPIHLLLLVAFALVVWPLLGISLQP
ncbi:sodium-dependent dicarboxylate transporter 2/3/5 [Bradyrhizobium sp. AZCC 1719]|uniref:SLC13 family permease n=1 Tax=Bradyrhizobium sp. AZCC 1719 TaxID=3117028 RepID=UPI002FEFC5B6